MLTYRSSCLISAATLSFASAQLSTVLQTMPPPVNRRDSTRGSIPSMEAAGDVLADNTVIVVLGASGDLAQKKTFPALFALYQTEFLPKDCKNHRLR